jgi:hypothetical protein
VEAAAAAAAGPDARGPARSARVIARTALRRETPALRAAFLGRNARLTADDRRLAEYQSASVTPASGASAAVFSIRPLAGSPAVSRLGRH